ncbi:MAG: stimulus-sensing domain-containing protein [Alphaproteobacteria bacterium]|nr:stimulus-sensing domain-containing protein [Alphaproteobacteria bacterium]
MELGINIRRISSGIIAFAGSNPCRSAFRAVREHWEKWHNRVSSDVHEERYLSPLMLRILAVNVMALAILVGSVLYLSRYQDRLIDSSLEALQLQARLSASALGEGAVVIDDDERNILSPLLSRLMIRRLVEATDTRTRLFGVGNTLIADSSILLGRMGKIQVEELKSSFADQSWFSNFIMSAFDFIDRLVEKQQFPVYQEEHIQRGNQYDIVKKAAQGERATQVWRLPKGGLLLAVAVPVQRYKQVLGALMLSRPDNSIDEAIREVRLDILKIFTITLFITTLLSLYLARAIARPIRLLAQAAEGVRHGQMQIIGLAGTANLLNKNVIPDFSSRKDEIGDLSAALRDMTAALAQRIGSIENFAADVAHEIKNPLTSLRSAVETAERVQDPSMQRRLMVVIRDDVDRLDRLISDISNASRLDAELSRDEAVPININQMLLTLTDFYRVMSDPDVDKKHRKIAEVILAEMPTEKIIVRGVEVRLVQVLQNLISNALSFSPPHGCVMIGAKSYKGTVLVIVEDEGPGIPENKLTNIFDRFYSERPKSEKFGTHSGLGLSISKQIIEAHRGRIWAENILDAAGRITGARFVVQLPASI